jgi:hypothetical protein
MSSGPLPFSAESGGQQSGIAAVAVRLQLFKATSQPRLAHTLRDSSSHVLLST